MNRELGKSIEESIKKNLPAQVADQLRDRLEELESTEKQHNELLSDFQIQKEELQELSAKDRDYSNLEELRAQLKKESEDLELQKLKFEIKQQLSDLKVEEADKRATVANNIVSLLVKNPEAITMINTNTIRGDMYYDNQGVQHTENLGSYSTVQTTNEK